VNFFTEKGVRYYGILVNRLNFNYIY